MHCKISSESKIILKVLLFLRFTKDKEQNTLDTLKLLFAEEEVC
jgi:hypothetical protein